MVSTSVSLLPVSALMAHLPVPDENFQILIIMRSQGGKGSLADVSTDSNDNDLGIGNKFVG
jgi:hypothetical protein